MKRLLLLILCVGSTLFVASALAGAKGGPPSTNWSMTIDDTLSNGTDTVIRSDAQGPYINGRDGVSLNASFINLWPRTDLGTRNVNFNNGGRLSDTNLAPPVVNDNDTPPTGLTGTALPLTDPHGSLNFTTPLVNMTAGSTQCGSFFLAAHDSNSGFVWRLANFQGGVASGPGTSFVIARRTSSTTWTVESDYSNVCLNGTYSPVGMILHDETSTSSKGKPTTITHADGYFNIPFHLTLTLD